MPPKKLRRGVGASCRVAKRLLHPKRKIAECSAFFNVIDIDNLLLTGRGEHKIKGNQKAVCFFRHPDLEGVVLYCHEKFAKVTSKGPAKSIFPAPPPVTRRRIGSLVSSSVQNSTANPNASTSPVSGGDSSTIATSDLTSRSTNNRAPNIPPDLFHSTNVAEDIAAVRNLGFIVDDDNDPAPENVPGPTTNATLPRTSVTNAPKLCDTTQGWNDVYVDRRKASGAHDIKPSLPGLLGKDPKKCTYLEIFLMFLGNNVVKTIVLPATNANLPHGVQKVAYGKFLQWIGMWLLMATSNGYVRADYWLHGSKRERRIRKVPYDFNDYMSKRRFDTILKHIAFTTYEAPNYLDKFWRVRQMITEWNRNVNCVFVPRWAVCLDESLSIWTKKWTCPGWVFCPRKPHPFGNEYHSICCGLCAIMFGIDLVEGRDHPPELPSKDPNRNGPTVSLLLRMCESIYYSGRVVILDSGFCVMKGIVELYKRGVYAGAVIKKRRYWPKHVPGDAIDAYMNSKNIGDTASLTGNLDGVDYTIFAMKEPDYTSKIMANYGNLHSDDRWEERSRRETMEDGSIVKKYFKYILPFQNHFTWRHCVDDHNNHRHQVPSIEGTWKTITWENRVFAFILAISEVNCWLAVRYFVWGEREDEADENKQEKKKLLFFRIELAEQLVTNPK